MIRSLELEITVFFGIIKFGITGVKLLDFYRQLYGLSWFTTVEMAQKAFVFSNQGFPEDRPVLSPTMGGYFRWAVTWC